MDGGGYLGGGGGGGGAGHKFVGRGGGNCFLAPHLATPLILKFFRTSPVLDASYSTKSKLKLQN